MRSGEERQRGGQSEQESNPRSSTRKAPSLDPKSVRPSSSPGVGGGGEAGDHQERGAGGGARSVGRGPSALGCETPPTARRAGVLRPPPNTCGWGETRGAPRPSPLPRRLKQRSPGARPGSGGAAHRASVGRAPSPGACRPSWLPAGFGPATWGYWSSSRSRGGGRSPLAEGSRGARPRGQSAAGAAAASPPRSGLVWSGPAGPLRSRRRERYKLEKGGRGCAGKGVGCGDPQATPPCNFSPMGVSLRLSTQRQLPLTPFTPWGAR